jgi:hypothetical protein
MASMTKGPSPSPRYRCHRHQLSRSLPGSRTCQVEQLQHALDHPEIRDEAVQSSGLIEHVSIGPADNGLEIEIVGEIAKMVELGIESKSKRANLDERLTRSVKVVAGARNQRYLHLDHAIL